MNVRLRRAPECCDICYLFGPAGAGLPTARGGQIESTHSCERTDRSDDKRRAERHRPSLGLRRQGRTKSQWATDPWGRSDARFWNGRRWTEHVVINGRQVIDPPFDDAVPHPSIIEL